MAGAYSTSLWVSKSAQAIVGIADHQEIGIGAKSCHDLSWFAYRWPDQEDILQEETV